MLDFLNRKFFITLGFVLLSSALFAANPGGNDDDDSSCDDPSGSCDNGGDECDGPNPPIWCPYDICKSPLPPPNLCPPKNRTDDGPDDDPPPGGGGGGGNPCKRPQPPAWCNKGNGDPCKGPKPPDYCEQGCDGNFSCPWNDGSPSNQSFGFSIPFGGIPFESELQSGAFRVRKVKPSPTIFTPQIFYYASKIGSQLSKINTFGNIPDDTDPDDWTVAVVGSDGSKTNYTIDPLFSSIGYPRGQRRGSTKLIRLLNENGTPMGALFTRNVIDYPDGSVTEYTFNGEPSYVEEYHANGTSMRYDWDTRFPVSYTSPTGRVVTFSELPDAVEVDIIREDGVLRQVKASEGLADFVQTGEESFEIRFYTYENIGTKNVDGIYVPLNSPYRTYKFENNSTEENDYSKIKVTTTWGSRTRIDYFDYNSAIEGWDLSRGGSGGILSKEVRTKVNGPSSGERTYTRSLYDANDVEVSRTVEVRKDFSWGGDAIVKKIQDPDGLNEVTTYSYYTNSSEPGYGNIKLIEYPDGYWQYFEYDENNAIVLRAVPWKDSPASNAETGPRAQIRYDYTPVDPSDVSLFGDFRPRTMTYSTIEEASGSEIVTKIIYSSFSRNTAGEYIVVEEWAASNTAAYGDSGNLRNTTTYYTTDSGDSNYDAVAAGRVKHIDYLDDTRDAFSYSQNTSDLDLFFSKTKSMVTPSSPNGVSGKSARNVTTWNHQGDKTEYETYVYVGGWQKATTTTHEYDDEGFETASYTDGRQIYAAEYVDGLMDSETNADGIEKLYTYDDLERLTTIVKVGAPGTDDYPAQVDIVTTLNRKLGEIDCGCDGETVTTLTGGALSLQSSEKKDKLGRISEQTDEAGLVTSWNHANGGRTVTQNNPNTSTRIVSRYMDRRIKSITGTGVIAEYYDYGVNADGSTWEEVRIGASDSPRYKKTTRDVMGRVIKEESPDATGGTFTVENTYNALGQLVKVSQPGLADILYEYDSLANPLRSGFDIDGNGSLVLASTDRIIDEELSYEHTSGALHETLETRVYASDNSATAITLSETRTKLSGYSGNVALEETYVDVHGNETINTLERDFSSKTVTETLNYPGSDIDEVSVLYNGLGVEQNSLTVADPTIFSYDDLARPLTVHDPRHANASAIAYNSSTGQIATLSDAAGNVTTFTYYQNNELGAGRPLSIENALGKKAYLAYDALGREVRRWGQSDYPVEMSYDSYGELDTLTTWRDPSGTYDFTTATWPSPTGGDTTTWTYQTSTGLLTRKEYADGNGTDYTHDSANRLATRVWERGITTTYGYNTNTGQLTSVDYSDTTTDLTYTHDRLGRRKTVTDVTGTRTFAYDTSTLQLDTETLDSTFDSGRILKRNYQDGTETNGLLGRMAGYALTTSDGITNLATAAYTFNSNGRLGTVGDGTDTFTYAYLANSDLLDLITGPVHTVDYSYETNRDVRTLVENTETVGTSSVVSSYAYRYDGLGRRTDVVNEGSAFASSALSLWSYNYRSEVTGQNRHLGTDPDAPGTSVPAEDFSYTFDNIGNREDSTAGTASTRAYTVDSLNQYTAITNPSVSPTHDADGNLTYDGSQWHFTWNGENRLIEARDYASSPVDGSIRLSHEYDYMGRLVSQKKETYSSGSSSFVISHSSLFIYDGWNRIAKFVSGALGTAYLWGLDLSGALQRAGGIGGLLKEGGVYPLYDANGNITQKLDNTGVTTMAVEYDPFGNIISGTFVGDYGFSTKSIDSDTGFSYFGFRWYNAETGRWLSRDPLGYVDGPNVYAYVGNSPISFWDLLGLARCRDEVMEELRELQEEIDSTHEGLDIVERMNATGETLEEAGGEIRGTPAQGGDTERLDRFESSVGQTVLSIFEHISFQVWGNVFGGGNFYSEYGGAEINRHGRYIMQLEEEKSGLLDELDEINKNKKNECD